MSLKGKKVLVTGAGGFIGSHLTEALVKEGCSVKAFVYYNAFNSNYWLDTIAADTFKELEIFRGDVRDPNGVREAMRGIDVVFHLAALIGIPYSYHSPDSYVDTNIKGTLNVLQAARDFGTERVIHTSTSEVYGSAQTVPIPESHPLVAQSPYAASKVAADQMALSFWRSFETPVTVLRPFNTFGPRQSTRAVIPTIITQIAKGKTTISLGNTSPTRDFTYVTDTAEAFIATAKSEKALGQIINGGTGFEISIADLVNTIARLMDADIKIESEAERLRPDASEVDRLCADNRLAAELLDWQPEFSGSDGLEAGLQKTVDWFTKPENLKHYVGDNYAV